MTQRKKPAADKPVAQVPSPEVPEAPPAPTTFEELDAQNAPNVTDHKAKASTLSAYQKLADKITALKREVEQGPFDADMKRTVNWNLTQALNTFWVGDEDGN